MGAKYIKPYKTKKKKTWIQIYIEKPYNTV